MITASDLNLIAMTDEEFPRALRALRSGILSGVAPGAVLGVWLKNEPDSLRVAALGDRRLIPLALPMEVDTVFDLASVSKVFATATLAGILVDRRWIRWDTTLRAIFPDYPHAEIEVRHLLAHTAGLPAWKPLWETLRGRFASRALYEISIEERQKAMRELVFAVEPEVCIDERAVYSDLSFLLLGFLLEEVTGMSLDRAVNHLVWEPLGVRRAFYRHVDRDVDSGRMDRVAATEDSAWRGGLLQGQVHDDNCWAMGGYAGHAGAFADVRDVLQFARRLFDGFLSRETLSAMWTRVAKPSGCERTLGWDTPSGPNPAAKAFSASTVGHLGYTGTSLWIDPPAGIAVALLTNRVHPTRENDRIRALRPMVHEALRRDLSKV